MSYIWTRATPYIIFIAFAALSIIFWIIYCICSCKPCCCFKQTENDSQCFKVTTVVLFMLVNIGIIIGSILAFTYSG